MTQSTLGTSARRKLSIFIGLFSLGIAACMLFASPALAATTAKTSSSQTTATTQSAQKATSSTKKTASTTAQDESNDLVSGGVYLIKMKSATSQVVSVESSSKKSGANVESTTSTMSKSQKWKVTNDSKGYTRFTNVNSGKVLSAENSTTASSDNVIQKAKSSSDNAQKWLVSKNSDGSYRITSALSATLCLEVKGSSAKDGVNVRVAQQSSAAGQRFAFIRTDVANANPQNALKKIDDSWYAMRSSAKTSLVANVKGAARTDGTILQAQLNKGRFNQLFKFIFEATSGTQGYYRIVDANSGKYVGLKDGNLVSGTAVEISSKTDGYSQLWRISKAAKGYQFTNAGSGLVLGMDSKKGADVLMYNPSADLTNCFSLKKRTSLLSSGFYAIKAASKTSLGLDINGASKNSDAQALLYTYNKQLNQKWHINRVKGLNNVYTIESINSGKRLAVASTKKNALVTQQTASNSKLQNWVPVILANGTLGFNNYANEKFRLEMKSGRLANSTKIQIGKAADVAKQRFSVVGVRPMEAGTYLISCQSAPNVALNVKGASKDDGASIELRKKDAEANNQKWALTLNKNGSWRIANCPSKKSVDINNGKAKAGTNIIQWESHSEKNQQWSLVYVPGTGSFKVVSKLDSTFGLAAKKTKSGANVYLGALNSANALQVSFTPTVYHPYTGVQLQMFNMAKNMASKTKWLILVDRVKCYIGILEGKKGKWDFVKFERCVTGNPALATDNGGTPLGTFTVGQGASDGWPTKLVHLPNTSLAKWCTEFFMDAYFHSVLNSEAELGHRESHGCVRLAWNTAKWVYDTIPAGTKVKVYEG